MKRFSIIIPTLNEADNILPLLSEIAVTAERLKLEPEIIFVDDGSTDGTRSIVAEYSGALAVRLICRNSKPGLARAVVAGAAVASNETVVVMDADLSHSPEMIPALLLPITENKADMVIGSRFADGAATPGLSSTRRTCSILATWPTFLFTNVKDPLSGFFAIDRQRLSSVLQTGAGFKIVLEILAGAESGFRVAEVPIRFCERFTGHSKMNTVIIYEYLKQLLRLARNRMEQGRWDSASKQGFCSGILDLCLILIFISFGTRIEAAHMVSLVTAAHATRILPSLLHHKPFFATKSSYLSFLVVLFLGVFLRGGIIALFYDLQAVPFLTASGYLSTGWIISTVAFAAMNGNSLMPTTAGNWTRPAIFLIGYSILLRLFYLGGPELLTEEAYYWNYSQHLAPGYLDHPPMVALLIKLGTSLFGHNEFGVRAGALVCWFIAAVFVFKLSCRLLNRDFALRALVLFSMLPIFFGVGFLMTPDAPLIACWAGSLYFFYRALVEDHTPSWYSAGLVLGLGMSSKYTISFLAPALILFMLLQPAARKHFFRPHPYLAAVIALIVFSPVIWWNYHNDWASFLFQSKTRLQAHSEFSTHVLLASILLLLTPTGVLAGLSILRKGRDTTREMIIGCTKGFSFCMITGLVPLTIFILFSFTKEVKLNWTGPLWISLIPIIAFTMHSRPHETPQLLPRMWPRTFIFLGLGYGLLLHYSTIGLPRLPYLDDPFLFGWDGFAQKIEEKVKEIENEDGLRPMVAGTDKYQTASGLAFYRFKVLPEKMKPRSIAETTGRHLFGYNALMYGFWQDPADIGYRSVLVVSPDRKRLLPAYLNSHHLDLEEIQEIEIEKRGQKVGTYYCRLVKGYRLPPPSLMASN